MSTEAFRRLRRTASGDLATQCSPTRHRLIAALAGVLLSLGATRADAGFELLHAFENPPRNPTSLVRGSDGALFGTTLFGGLRSEEGVDRGGIFRVEEDGSGFQMLHVFELPTDASPSGLVAGADGALYGTTWDGGVRHEGTIFRLEEDGSGFETLHAFDQADLLGAFPSGLLWASDGSLYGLTGTGSVFAIQADGSGLRTVHAFGCFEEGWAPSAIVEGPDGVLYGATATGGSSGAGTLFSVRRDGRRFQKLYDFAWAEGAAPNRLVATADGALYGTTSWGGAFGEGTLFRLTLAQRPTFTKLHDFEFASGAFPSSLVTGSDGALYGTTGFGGPSSFGTLFRLAHDGSGLRILLAFDGANGSGPKLAGAASGVLFGSAPRGGQAGAAGGAAGEGLVFAIGEDGERFRKLHTFGWGDGAFPLAGLVEGDAGELFGTTSGHEGGGTLFRMDAGGSNLQKLHDFDGVHGASPSTPLIVGTDGSLYGATLYGGNFDEGTVFRIEQDGSAFQMLQSLDWAVRLQAQGVVEGPDGLLYGMTRQTGGSGCGTIFALPRDGSEPRLLHHLDPEGTEGCHPSGPLVVGSDGGLYGVTSGSENLTVPTPEGDFAVGASVFRLREDGSGVQTLRVFDGSYAPDPVVLSKGPGDLLYGVAAGHVFQMREDGSGFREIRAIQGVSHLFAGADGTLYGAQTRIPAGTASRLAATAAPARSTTSASATCGPLRPPREASVVRLTLDGLLEPSACVSEPVAFTALLQRHVDTTPSRGSEPASSEHVRFDLVLQLDGVGLTSGDRYQATEAASFDFLLDFSEEPLPITVIWRTRPTVTRGHDRQEWVVEVQLSLVLHPDETIEVADGFQLRARCPSEPGSLLMSPSSSAQAATAVTAGDGHRGPSTAESSGSSWGTVFRLAADGSTFEVLHELTWETGAIPAGLMQASDGALYGTATLGGPGGAGVVFRIDPP